ncbi:MAG: ADP-glyceromanno-heptose 6-epimerase [Prolixibacteraceae bacterium]|nr:ADP-glyceromanno-heptose 6-epimerase [Prolixibacteraceae bacterium]MBN2774736.1 ADP-glyceromanno-heptose 6-epimerase [Prolixibacteraceae bacterium]
MIVVTGAAGFIGSYLVGKLNRNGFKDLILVDTFDDPAKECNLNHKVFNELVDRDKFFHWLTKNQNKVDLVYHLGARTDTVGQEPEIYKELNLRYSQKLWQVCTDFNIPFVYASSAATYGNGDMGFSDKHEGMNKLKPLNLYAWSKHDFDIWALNQKETPSFWAGLKFFNVYGPNEYHKGDMASVVLHAFNKIKDSGEMKLFRSHRPDIKDGEQKRDFIHVDDITEVMMFFMENQNNPGIYNVGTGKARSYLELTRAVFESLNMNPEIQFVDTPASIRNRYQYFTEAKIQKLREIGYSKPFCELEDGIGDYVTNYLVNELTY